MQLQGSTVLLESDWKHAYYTAPPVKSVGEGKAPYPSVAFFAAFLASVSSKSRELPHHIKLDHCLVQPLAP